MAAGHRDGMAPRHRHRMASRPCAMIDARAVERIVRRYLCDTEAGVTGDVYQEVQDLDPNLPPGEVARLVDRAVVRIVAENGPEPPPKQACRRAPGPLSGARRQ